MTTAKDLLPKHKITLAQFETISLMFGCSSRKGQPYMLYGVYDNADSPKESVKWYIRYVKKEFTKFGRQTTENTVVADNRIAHA